MRIVLTNDDGIDAPGIRALHKAVNGLGVIVAPKDHLSGCGHQVTTTQPIHVQRRSDLEYAIAGTPADCVRLAITHICQDVNLVLSGINAGGNLGDVAARWTAGVLADLLKRPAVPGTFWNVNLPHLEPGEPDPEVVFCEPSTQPLPANYRMEGEHFHYVGEYALRDRAPGTDVDVCFSGRIAITELRL